jgi:DNA repair protein RadC
VGTLTSAVVHPREVFKTAIRESADALVFVHNHPSGDPTPSVEDIEITDRLLEVSRLVGIRVLDHVVIGDGAYVSFHERGLIDVE